jgi:hypothetical protein
MSHPTKIRVFTRLVAQCKVCASHGCRYCLSHFDNDLQVGNFSLAEGEGAAFGVSKVYFEFHEPWKDLCESFARDVTTQFLRGEGRPDREGKPRDLRNIRSAAPSMKDIMQWGSL